MQALAYKSDYIYNNTAANEEMETVIDTINLIFAHLKLIRMKSKNGHILDEIIERTEVLAFQAKNEPSLINLSYIKSYQKNLWQILKSFVQQEVEKSREEHLEAYKTTFFELFSILNKALTNLIPEKQETEYSALVYKLA
ncbi:MAG: hypothetical protein U5K69_18055 [Balneolaceae bacterium]|nr:hypothetical protein [Balneolaceae bacterium]